MTRRRSLWAWGLEADGLSDQEVDGLAGLLAERFPAAELRREAPVPLAEAVLPPARLPPPASLAGICSIAAHDRALHARGRSYTDVVYGFRGMFESAPDLVARPRDTGEVNAVLDWAASVDAAVIPFGGGTSVVGGVTPSARDRPLVTLQMRAMGRVTDVDGVSLAARIEGGATGPVIEEQLQRHGLTLRFFPQSFELSTLGGWIATRAAGHYATRLTRIDDLTEQVDAVTPSGVWESHRVPSSGAGPSPDRLLLGSEGALGVITSAWMRVQERPRHRARASVRFPTFRQGSEAVRALAQSGLDPANCRLLDPLEGLLNGVAGGRRRQGGRGAVPRVRWRLVRCGGTG
jgi:alkyldihydroxyacetonephosphate synthase